MRGYYSFDVTEVKVYFYFIFLILEEDARTLCGTYLVRWYGINRYMYVHMFHLELLCVDYSE